MTFHMIVTTEIDYEWDVDNHFGCIGLPERNKKALQQMETGSKVVYYVSKQSKFMAIVEVTGEYYYSEEQIWDDPYDLWPHRRPTKPILFLDDFSEGIYIKDIWDRLDFIKNTVKWGSQVQGSFKRLSEHDYNVIAKALEKDR